MLQPNQIQDFLVRAVTGLGERVQSKDLTDQDLSDMTYKIRNLAGKVMFRSWYVYLTFFKVWHQSVSQRKRNYSL